MSLSRFEKRAFKHPFDGALLFYTDITESTMDDARTVLLHYPNIQLGTVVQAGFQTKGRGRIEGRVWQAKQKENLLCTVILPIKPPAAFTLRVGLAIADTYRHFIGENNTSISIKWPNDVLYKGKKLSGVLCESDGHVIFAGTGCNIGQTDFPEDIRQKVSSLSLILQEANTAEPIPSVSEFLYVYLEQLKKSLIRNDWKSVIESQLAFKHEKAIFTVGDPRKNEKLTGIIQGISDTGELLLQLESGKIKNLSSGEIDI